MKNFFKKLQSRKFLTAAAGILTGAALALGAGRETVEAVCGAVMASISLVAYIVTEGRIDAAHAADAIEKIQSSIDMLEGEDNAK